MEVSATISPVTGQRVYLFGGRHSWRQHTHKGFVVSLEWVRKLHHRRNPPKVMCIWADVAIDAADSGDRGTWVINANDIVNFVQFNAAGKCTGSVSRYAIAEAAEALPILGKDRNDRQALLALLDVIVKFAPDLVMMPKAPRDIIKSLSGEAIFDMATKDKNSGKTIAEDSA